MLRSPDWSNATRQRPDVVAKRLKRASPSVGRHRSAAVEPTRTAANPADSVGREAVEQPIAAGAPQVGLCAATARPARGMRGIPRLRRRLLVQSHAVVVADHRGAGAALGPVAAGAIVAAGESRAVRLRASKDVVTVRRVAATVDRLALLAQRVLLVDGVVRAVQVGDVLGDHGALGVLPRSAPDAVLRIDRAGALGRQIGAPGLPARARGLRERLAVAVGAVEPAEIAAIAGTGAGDEEGHRILLRLRTADDTERNRACDQGYTAWSSCFLLGSFPSPTEKKSAGVPG